MTIVITIAAMIVAALFLAGAGVYWATHASDSVSVERQARSAQHAMEISVDELALQQETVAIWDDATSHLVADRLDMTWIHDNIGSWLHRIFGAAFPEKSQRGPIALPRHSRILRSR